MFPPFSVFDLFEIWPHTKNKNNFQRLKGPLAIGLYKGTFYALSSRSLAPFAALLNTQESWDNSLPPFLLLHFHLFPFLKKTKWPQEDCLSQQGFFREKKKVFFRPLWLLKALFDLLSSLRLAFLPKEAKRSLQAFRGRTTQKPKSHFLLCFLLQKEKKSKEKKGSGSKEREEKKKRKP